MKKIFFVIWGDPKFYQTLIFLSQKLSKKKFKIYVISRNLNNFKDVIQNVNFGKKVKLLNPPNFINYKFNFINYLFFHFFVVIQLILKKPKHVVFFNKKALLNILFSKILNKKTKFIYHNFDFDLISNTKNFNEKILVKLEFFSSKICDYLIFPSKKRAKLFKKYSKNNLSKYYSFMNCFPKKIKTNNSLKFRKFIIKNKFQSKNIVCHLGSIGPKHFLNEIVESFKYTNNRILLVIAGSSINGFGKKLKKIIEVNNLEKKIFVFEDVSNDYWFEILKNSHLGLCFYKQSSLSHRHMAGTSQKFNNYLFFNIPMITNNNSDFKNFKKNYDILEMVNPKSPKLIAQKIDYLFSKKKRYKQIKNNMKIAFAKKLNFDSQYNESYNYIL